MLDRAIFRRLLLGLLSSLALAAAGMTLPVIPGAVTPAYAQVSAEFQEALEPYGHWVRHARWGEIWVPEDVPAGWRPYEYGHWVYTDDWGWYWISDPEEEDWGWVTFHYGRWVNDRQSGWFWIPGDEWAPAWVDWRYGGDYVGWAPMPPDAIVYEYDDNPIYWVIVASRFLTASRLHDHALRSGRHTSAFRNTRLVNRTIGYGRGRAAVNAGLSPALIARATRTALPTYRVSPRVLAGTQGVAGAVRVTPQQLQAGRGGAPQRGRKPSATHANAVAVQRTTETVKPAASAAAPQPLGKGERGKLGSHPPRAAQGAPAPQQQAPQQQQKAAPPSPAPAATQPHAPAAASAPPAVVQPHAPPQAKPERPTPPQTPRHRRSRSARSTPRSAGGSTSAATCCCASAATCRDTSAAACCCASGATCRGASAAACCCASAAACCCASAAACCGASAAACRGASAAACCRASATACRGTAATAGRPARAAAR